MKKIFFGLMALLAFMDFSLFSIASEGTDDNVSKYGTGK